MGSDEIRSQGFSLNELFRDVTYEIDYYQRDYTWGEDEVRTLLRDLCGSFRNWSANPSYLRRPHTAPQYFLGPFVYYEPDKHQRYLVDGQQRFVTLHLLFLQLRLAAQERGDTRAVDRLNRVITTDGQHFSLGITDHEPILRAVAQARGYETVVGDSLSRRNLWATQPADRIPTATDLLKSHLLSHVGENEDQLNTQWHEMLRELATDREDSTTASRFIKAFLLARYARESQDDDRRQIDSNLNVWVRQNAEHLGLVPERPDYFLHFVQDLLKTARLYRPFLAAGRALKTGGDRLEAVLFNERNGLGCQAVALLAVIDPDDRPSDAKDKGRLSSPTTWTAGTP
ncbi:DUF262 domain-containing protein [Streptomyces sp. GLT-R25]